MAEDEKFFSCQLHGQEVQAVCHDIMQITHLGKMLSRCYGRPLLSLFRLLLH